jgi:RNA-binding protein
MPLSSKQRAALRGEAHHLTALVHVGQHGVTDAVRRTIDDDLRTHELVKIQFTKNAALDVKDAANQLASALGADVVQVIGKTATLYRENPELERKGDAPHLRR